MVSDRLISRLERRPLLIAGVLVVLVFSSITLLREFGYLQGLELAVYDMQVRHRPQTEALMTRVVLVGIDEADIQRLGRWPLSDATLAQLLETISSDGPQVLGLDIYRDKPVPPGTERLNQAFSTGNLVVVEKFGGRGSPSIAPPPVLAGSDRVGFSDIVVDPDGVVRRGLLYLDDGQDISLSLSLRLALSYLAGHGIYPQPGVLDPENMRLGKVTLSPFEPNDGGYVGADARGYQYLLDYRDGSKPFSSVAFSDVMSGKLPPGSLQGKIVIVGVTADSVKDYFLTPFGSGGGDGPTEFGITLHGRMASQIVRAGLDDHRPIRVISEAAEYAWLLLWAAGGVLAAFCLRSLWWLTLCVAAGLLVLVLSSFAAFLGGWWIPLAPAVLGWLAAASLMSAYLSGHEKRQRGHLMDLFGRHVSQDVAEEIWTQRDRFLSGGRLRSRKTIATVLFTDLENFTTISENMDPAVLMEWLNEYLEAMVGLVMEHGGTVDDYYGDAIKANFGVPLIQSSDEGIGKDADRAVQCALAMRDEIQRLNRDWQERGFTRLRMRVGICTGPVVAGCLGSTRRMKYTTVGDTVNTAARLESYGKDLEAGNVGDEVCRILLADSTARFLGHSISMQAVQPLALKGKSGTMKVYCVTRNNDDIRPVHEGKGDEYTQI